MAEFIQLRRDTTAGWVAANPILRNGEIGYNTDTKVQRIGNGVDTWTVLPDYLPGNLINVDNTADLDKPISVATQTALALKANKSDVDELIDFHVYDASKAYSENDPTFYLGVPYKSIYVGSNTGNRPDISPTHWEVTGGGSGSATNVGYNFENGQFETHTIGWNIYKDAAGVLPVDGTGQAGTPTTTFTRNTTTPINGLGDGLLSKTSGASRQGEGVSYDFTIDPGQTTSPAQITFTYKTPVAYTDGMLGVFLYDKTNGALIRMSVENIPATYGSISQFLTTFIPSTSLDYRLIFHVIDATSSTWTFEVDNIQVGQKNVAVGAAIGNWIDFPVVIANTGTLAASGAQYRRVGSNMEVRGYLQKNGTAETVPSYVNILFPTGFSLSPYSVNLENGTWSKSVNTTASTIASGTCLITAGGVLFRWLNLGNGVTGALSSTQLEANQLISFSFYAPIAQWTSNVNMASDFTEYAFNKETVANTSNTNSFGYGSQGVNVLAHTITTYFDVKWQKPMQNSDAVYIETSEVPNVWQVITQRFPYVTTAGYQSGVRGIPVDAYIYRVYFQVLPEYGSTWAGNTGMKWRVRKVSNGNMAEVPPVVHAEYNAPYNAFQTAGIGTALRFTNKIEDTHSAYNMVNGVYTAPISGVYEVALSCGEAAGLSGVPSQLFINIAGTRKATIYFGTVSGYTTHAGSKRMRVLSGQTIAVEYLVGSVWSVNGDINTTYITITRIGS